jgi:hypothetical protein
LLLRLGAEQNQRQQRQVGLPAEGGAERRRARHPFADEQRGDLVEVEASVGLRHVDAEQPELAAALDQPSREIPVVLFEPAELGQHLLFDELLGGVPDQPMLVGDAFRRQHLPAVGRLDQPGAATKL